MNIYINKAIPVIALLLALHGCKSLQQSSSLPSAPPSASSPSASGSPASAGRSSTGSTGAEGSTGAGGSTGGGGESSLPSSGSGLPVLDGSSGSVGSSGSSKGGNAQSRQAAAKALQKAGKRLGQTDILHTSGKRGTGGLPQQASKGAESGDPMEPVGGAGQGGGEQDPMLTEEGALAAEIGAAQEALQQTSEALQTAGAQLGDAATDAEISAAEAALSQARLMVLVTGQDLLEIREALEAAGTLGNPEQVLGEAEAVLDEAVGVIVAANRALFPEDIPLANFPTQPGQGQAGMDEQTGLPGEGTRESQLDKELNESIAIFEGRLMESRREALNTMPPPTSAEKIPGAQGLGGTPSSVGAQGAKQEGGLKAAGSGAGNSRQQGQNAQGTKVASNTEASVPEDLPDPQGDDIVAKQLREAATAETDPELKEKLWEEYRKYRENL